ncbi:MAG: hypothetical protein M5U07_00940 [Xanthobacteraceae bacterium]|nr:hypothetical protein [Xanthobacteraceae bacterium]
MYLLFATILVASLLAWLRVRFRWVFFGFALFFAAHTVFLVSRMGEGARVVRSFSTDPVVVVSVVNLRNFAATLAAFGAVWLLRRFV